MVYRRIRDLREDNDLTQADVGNILHVSRRRYSDYERGISTIPLDCLIQLAAYYHTSVDYLLERTHVRDPYPTKRPTL